MMCARAHAWARMCVYACVCACVCVNAGVHSCWYMPRHAHTNKHTRIYTLTLCFHANYYCMICMQHGTVCAGISADSSTCMLLGPGKCDSAQMGDDLSLDLASCAAKCLATPGCVAIELEEERDEVECELHAGEAFSPEGRWCYYNNSTPCADNDAVIKKEHSRTAQNCSEIYTYGLCTYAEELCPVSCKSPACSVSSSSLNGHAPDAPRGYALIGPGKCESADLLRGDDLSLDLASCAAKCSATPQCVAIQFEEGPGKVECKLHAGRAFSRESSKLCYSCAPTQVPTFLPTDTAQYNSSTPTVVPTVPSRPPTALPTTRSPTSSPTPPTPSPTQSPTPTPLPLLKAPSITELLQRCNMAPHQNATDVIDIKQISTCL